MRKTKAQKGITLIALIITIVVLLILAVVAINAIRGDGIINYAKNAANDYNSAQQEEQDTIQSYLDVLDTVAGKWQQSGTKITDGTTTLNVGDYVTGYTAGDTSIYAAGKNWQVLGADKGKVLITIANKPDNPSTSDTSEDGYLTLSGKADYTTTGLSKLQTEANKYLNTTYADSVRSMNLKDINKITGYNPDNAKWGHTITRRSWTIWKYCKV